MCKVRECLFEVGKRASSQRCGVVIHAAGRRTHLDDDVVGGHVPGQPVLPHLVREAQGALLSHRQGRGMRVDMREGGMERKGAKERVRVWEKDSYRDTRVLTSASPPAMQACMAVRYETASGATCCGFVNMCVYVGGWNE